jgi:hypothetical protein
VSFIVKRAGRTFKVTGRSSSSSGKGWPLSVGLGVTLGANGVDDSVRLPARDPHWQSQNLKTNTWESCFLCATYCSNNGSGYSLLKQGILIHQDLQSRIEKQEHFVNDLTSTTSSSVSLLSRLPSQLALSLLEHQIHSAEQHLQISLGQS